MGVLYDKQWLDQEMDRLPPWTQPLYKTFTDMLVGDNTYPCVPARQGFLENQLRFSFISDPREKRAAEEVATALKTYGRNARKFGDYTSLAVFFQTPKDMYTTYTVEDYRNLFWNIINKVTAYDEKAWPESIPQNPTHHEWEFCFDGEPYFIFCATPAHQKRKSRYFPCFFIAFQPRWVFANLNRNTAFGRKMKNIIRRRLIKYDGMPGHPDLKWYGQEDNHEWKQYFLSDEEDSPSKCPFMRMRQKTSSFFK
ncbi:hypothetical protein J32TS6_25090 [Virgibacillus pantothenticus]|uniref:YqcI/YcgG family protein n=1 Tax=Virgibacillus pantothenticus TaxID=1473 RepID=UPI001B115B05|nr:YqcI/YcgG family protein [Virgibacillus pantothenticus]GIP63954.1 hypothetical protein J32TS6_25090 [Virgibacillus pantothenticus]